MYTDCKETVVSQIAVASEDVPSNRAVRDQGEVLVRVSNVSKKFCRSLKKSLWYGLKDIAHELNPFGPTRLPVTRSSTPNSHCFGLRQDEFWAVNDVSFELRRGDCLGLIGHNGAGKTTLLKMLNGLIKPDRGRIEIRGTVGGLIALGAGFNPLLTGRENIYINGAVIGLTKREIESRIEEIISFAEIEEFIDAPVQSYSSGMQVRLGFSIASCLQPDVLLVDEVLAVGDGRFRAKAKSKIDAMIANGTAVIFVSHNLHEVSGFTTKCVWLEKGEVRLIGSTPQVTTAYMAALAASSHQLSNRAGFVYSPNRTGLAVLSDLTHCFQVPDDGVQSEAPKRELDIQFSLTFSIPIDGSLLFGFNLTTSDERYIARSVIEVAANAIENELTNWRFRIKTPVLLPGDYCMQFFCWIPGGVMLEGMFNLFSFTVAPEDLESEHAFKKSSYCSSKIADNSRGFVLLETVHIPT